MTQARAIDAAAVERELDRVTGSRVFLRAARSQRLLRYLVAVARVDPACAVKEYTIATEVFDRGAEYDPSVDATVRVEAGRLRSRLREYYADEGRHDSIRFELPKGGYRVLVTEHAAEVVEEVPAAVTVVEAAPGRAADPAATTAGWRWRVVGLGAVVALVVGVLWWRVGGEAHRLPVVRSMAVLPLRNLSGDAGQEYFADGATDELITELARVPGMRVVSWNSVLQEKNTTKPLKAIAAELRADALVEGSVMRAGETVRINAQVIDARTDAHLWAGSFEGRAGEMMALESRVAQEIVGKIAHAGGGDAAEGGPTRVATAVDPAAHEAYLRGKNYFDKRRAPESVAQFERAIALNSRYAAAYAGLADALEAEVLLGEDSAAVALPKAMAAVDRSLALDPENGDALIARGSIEAFFLWEWDAAGRDLRRGIALSPSNSFGHMAMAVYLDSLGKPEGAVLEMRDAVEIDPLSFFMARHYGSTLFYARRYKEALSQLEYAREMHPASAAVVDLWISEVYEKEGRYDEAVRYDLMQMSEEQNLDGAGLLAVYQRNGWQAYWTERLKMMRQAKETDVCDGYFEGLAAVRAGRHAEALALLKEASERHCYWMGVSRVSPLLDAVRGEAGFGAVLAPLGLPPG